MEGSCKTLSVCSNKPTIIRRLLFSISLHFCISPLRNSIRRKEDQDKLQQRSIELEQENIRLRTELTKLRHAHRHCSVTQQMNLAATLASQSSSVGEPVILNATGPNQPPFLLTSPQQRLITSHIVNSHTMNTKPIFIVIGAGAASAEQDGTLPS